MDWEAGVGWVRCDVRYEVVLFIYLVKNPSMFADVLSRLLNADLWLWRLKSTTSDDLRSSCCGATSNVPSGRLKGAPPSSRGPLGAD